LAVEIVPQFGVRGMERVVIGKDSVPALLVRPDTDSPRPAALMQHGWTSCKEDFLPLALLLATYGFVSLLPDAWGHGERLPSEGPSWKTERNADYFIEVVRHTSEDLRATLGWLGEQPYTRPDTLIVGGFSMGAMAALITGTEDERVAAVISVSGSPLPDMANVTMLGENAPGPANQVWSREHDAAAHIARLAPKPLLIQHGRHDDMVPVEGALRLYAAAQPHYAAHPDRLALMLYDHTHTVVEAQLRDALTWLAPLFSDPEAPASDGASAHAGG
jgi:dienelactone hydrolase